MKKIEIEEKVNDFAFRLRKVIPYYGFSTTAIHLVFMKYICDFNNVKSTDEFKTLMTYKNMFINKKFSKDIVIKTFKMINDIYKIEDDLLLKTILFLEDIFKEEATSEYIFRLLNELELPDAQEDMIYFINYILEYSDYDISRNGNFITNKSLCVLTNKILDVKNNEVYLDCFSGFNRNALYINAQKYLGYEINVNTAVASNMIMILTGKTSFSIKNENFYLNKDTCKADKIFADGPIGLKLTKEEIKSLNDENKNCEYYNVKKSLTYLKENGVAVISVPSKILFSELLKNLREELTKNKLKAVIALPPLWNGVGINTNVLIFEKSKKDDNIIMIDASKKEYLDSQYKRTNELKDEVIETIIDCLNGKVIDDFSKIITTNDITSNEDLSWVPQTYIKRKKDVIYRPSIVVKKELEETYRELIDLLR